MQSLHILLLVKNLKKQTKTTEEQEKKQIDAIANQNKKTRGFNQ